MRGGLGGGDGMSMPLADGHAELLFVSVRAAIIHAPETQGAPPAGEAPAAHRTARSRLHLHHANNARIR